MNERRLDTFFASIAMRISAEIPVSSGPPNIHAPRIDAECSLHPVTVAEVTEVIEHYRSKRVGVREVQPSILYLVSDAVAPVLCDVFNRCFTTSTFPKSLKIARVTPVFKSGDRKLIDNYRPISNLSFFNKIFEKLINHIDPLGCKIC